VLAGLAILAGVVRRLLHLAGVVVPRHGGGAFGALHGGGGFLRRRCAAVAGLVALPGALSRCHPAGVCCRFDPSLRLLPGVEWLAPLWRCAIFCVVFTVWLVNLYNFMDGMDGLAGGMAVSRFRTLALLGYLAGSPAYAVAAALVAVAALVSCRSTSAGAPVHGRRGLGFAWGPGGALHAARRASAALPAVAGRWCSALHRGCHWTVSRAALHGRRPWQAHREHFYQRLVQSGWSHGARHFGPITLMLKLACFPYWHFGPVGQEFRTPVRWMAAVYLAIIAYVNAP